MSISTALFVRTALGYSIYFIYSLCISSS